MNLASLLMEIMDIESVSGNESALADWVEARLTALPHLGVHRDGDCIVARTTLGRAERVVIAGHLDTVPVAGNLPSRYVEHPDGDRVWGRGACDMKGGVAVMLHLAEQLIAPNRDITWIFYDNEEVEATRNGLGPSPATDRTSSRRISPFSWSPPPRTSRAAARAPSAWS